MSPILASSGRPPPPNSVTWTGVAAGGAVAVASGEIAALGAGGAVLDAVNGPLGDVVLISTDRLEWRRNDDLLMTAPVAGSQLAGRIALAADVIAFVDPEQNRIVVIDDTGAIIDEIDINPPRTHVTGLDLNRSGTDLVYSTITGELIWYLLDSPEHDVLLDEDLGYDGHFTSDGRVAAVGSDGAQLIDLDEPATPHALGFGRGAADIAYELDWPIAATLDDDGSSHVSLQLWDKASGAQIGTALSLPAEQARWIWLDGAGRLIVGGDTQSAALTIDPDAWRLQACHLAAVLDPGGRLPPDPRLKRLRSCA